MSVPPPMDGPDRSGAAQRKPLVLIPVTEADVQRKRMRIAGAIGGALLLAGAIVWFIFDQSTDRLEADQALENGQQLYAIGRFGEANMAFDRALSLNSRLSAAYLWRARGHVAATNYAAAVADLTEYVKRQPSDAEGWQLRAECYQQLKQYAKAVLDFDKAVTLNPGKAGAYVNRGVSYRYAGNLEKARADFEKAIELSGDLGGYFEHGALMQHLGDHRRAIEDFSKVIENRPDAPTPYLARAMSRRAVGDEEGARSDYAMGQRLEGR